MPDLGKDLTSLLDGAVARLNERDITFSREISWLIRSGLVTICLGFCVVLARLFFEMRSGGGRSVLIDFCQKADADRVALALIAAGTVMSVTGVIIGSMLKAKSLSSAVEEVREIASQLIAAHRDAKEN